MDPKAKIAISAIIGLLAISSAYFLFSSSLNDDGYIHFLKDSFSERVSEKDSQFVGFGGFFVPSFASALKTTYGKENAVFFKLDYQRYVCRSSGDGRSCSWETYRTERYSTQFQLDSIGSTVLINETSQVEFIPKSRQIFILGTDHRVIESAIKTGGQIYAWGHLENGLLSLYVDERHGKKILIVTDSARQALIDMISGVLYVQILSAAIVAVASGLIYLVNRRWNIKSYVSRNFSSGSSVTGQVSVSFSGNKSTLSRGIFFIKK